MESKTIGSINMAFAGGLEMLRLERILDSSLWRGSRATLENAFYMCYLFININKYLFIYIPDTFLPRVTVEKNN